MRGASNFENRPGVPGHRMDDALCGQGRAPNQRVHRGGSYLSRLCTLHLFPVGPHPFPLAASPLKKPCRSSLPLPGAPCARASRSARTGGRLETLGRFDRGCAEVRLVTEAVAPSASTPRGCLAEGATAFAINPTSANLQSRHPQQPDTLR